MEFSVCGNSLVELLQAAGSGLRRDRADTRAGGERCGDDSTRPEAVHDVPLVTVRWSKGLATAASFISCGVLSARGSRGVLFRERRGNYRAHLGDRARQHGGRGARGIETQPVDASSVLGTLQTNDLGVCVRRIVTAPLRSRYQHRL